MTNIKKVTLKTGIKLGKNIVTEFTIRKPMTGDLRGVTLINFIELDINALAKVLPHLVTPTLAEHEIFNLELEDLTQFATAISDFLSPKPETAKTESPTE